MDGDRGVNNPITYSLTGGPHHLFAVNKLSGLVYVKSAIDRESGEARDGAFILEVTATEVMGGGRRGESITTEVTIIVEVRRDKVTVNYLGHWFD